MSRPLLKTSAIIPELPEVETIARRLAKVLPGKRILEVDALWPGSIHKTALGDFCRRIRRSRIDRVSRRGKYLHLFLSQGGRKISLLVHLRMSGRLDLQDGAAPIAPHDRVLFKIEGGKRLCFNDVRKFGRIYLTDDASEITAALGPEPLENGLSQRVFFERLALKRTAIKALLLNQKFLAGIGNIYADESLWRARIHPERRSCTLSRREAARLLKAIRFTLQQAIRFHGTNAGDGVVDFGRYRPRAYGRGGEKCPRCGAGIRRIVVAQRGTHFCPRCQRISHG